MTMQTPSLRQAYRTARRRGLRLDVNGDGTTRLTAPRSAWQAAGYFMNEPAHITRPSGHFMPGEVAHAIRDVAAGQNPCA